MSQDNESGILVAIEEGWDNEIKPKAIEPLKVILDEGFKPGKQFTNAEYVATYTICYNMCTQRAPYNCSEQLYQRHTETIVEYLNDTVLPKLRSLHDVYLLQELVRRWNNHKIMNKWMKKFFMYLDRFYVKYHSLASLEEAGLNHFKTIVYEAVKNDITNSVLFLINQEREDVVIDRDLVKSCVELYGSMGMGQNDVYEKDMESQLLESSREYYARKANEWMVGDSTPEYLVKAEKALNSEKERVLSYLNPLTEMKLMAVMEHEVLEKKKVALIEKDGSGMRVLLANERVVDLSRMFQLFSRLKDGGLSPMAEILREHIAQLGFEVLEARRARIENLKEKETSQDPQLVRDLIALHDKYLDMVTAQFVGHSLFQKALRDAFSEIVNRDIGSVKNADLMSSFCDQILKTGGEKLGGGESEIENYLEKIVQLFSYLSDKDIFAEIYRNQLAKRLLNQRSASDDMEKLMISKLKLRCGNQFTSKMEGMLTDLQIGKDHQAGFERFYKEKNLLSFANGMDFSVQVLTTGYWPTYKLYDVVLPQVMSSSCQVFRTFYENETSGRRLQWVHSLGDAVIKGYFGSKKYEIQLTTLQAAALLAFNPAQSVTVSLGYSELSDSLQLPEEALKRVLHSLACGKHKILKKDGPANAIKSTDTFTVNQKFSSKSMRFRVPIATLEESHNPKRVEEDRGHTIEASIVRIMKARKTLGHQQLIGEVLTQLSFFRPDAKKVKRHIEALIEREYLERDENNRDVYKYLA